MTTTIRRAATALGIAAAACLAIALAPAGAAHAGQLESDYGTASWIEPTSGEWVPANDHIDSWGEPTSAGG